MGMYTECIGFLNIDENESIEAINQKINSWEGKTERSKLVINSTIANQGANGEKFIFIGGCLKNYDDDWELFINFLNKEFTILHGEIKLRYEEWENWKIVYSS